VLKRIKISKTARAGGVFAIVASKYNEVYVDSMVRAARRVLVDAGSQSIEVIRVPGAFEIPVVVANLARLQPRRFSAIICLGVILRGATTHAQHIGETVSQALMQIQIMSEVPVIHEVLLLENKQQAEERCLDRKHNRGAEAAYTALEMAAVMSKLGRWAGSKPGKLRRGKSG
jgi:6,7-dimethyl-8-ribityllumazine synthase